ncbi:MAG: lysophospholipid acyltransferase family protein, partial [Planctomycetota bacterium]
MPFLTGLARPVLRRQIHANLALAYGDDLGLQERAGIVRAVTRNLGLVIAENMACMRDKLPGDYLRDAEAESALRSLTGEGRGVIAVTAHLGNWELLGWWLKDRFPQDAGGAIAVRNRNPYFQRLIEQMHESFELPIIYQEESLRRSVRLLQDGKIVAIVPDQDICRIAGIFIDFFGRPAYTPTGPAGLSLLTGSPILVICSTRTEQGMSLHAFDPIRPDPERPRVQEIHRITRAWSVQIEAQNR